MGGRRSMMLRLDEDLAEKLQALADVEGRTLSDVIRQAIAEHIDRRRRDPEFRNVIRSALERQRRLLDLLAEDDA